MLLVTAAIFLFTVGLLMQFRLFSDPEYGARGAARSKAREQKAQTVRLLNIETAYDDQKKTFMFGSPTAVPKKPDTQAIPVSEYSLTDILTSVNTYIPIAALFAMALGFRLFKSDKFLLWFQRHALILGLATLVPFAIVVLISQEGKFLGQTTPWEGVKVLFLLSFAGMLADSYRHLRRTRWGLPPAGTSFPSWSLRRCRLAFFALSDFGQMLVFFGVYVMLYVVAVRKKAQFVYAVVLVRYCSACFLAPAKRRRDSVFPAELFSLLPMDTYLGSPAPDTWWWKRDLERYLQAKNLTLDPENPRGDPTEK